MMISQQHAEGKEKRWKWWGNRKGILVQWALVSFGYKMKKNRRKQVNMGPFPEENNHVMWFWGWTASTNCCLKGIKPPALRNCPPWQDEDFSCLTKMSRLVPWQGILYQDWTEQRRSITLSGQTNKPGWSWRHFPSLFPPFCSRLVKPQSGRYLSKHFHSEKLGFWRVFLPTLGLMVGSAARAPLCVMSPYSHFWHNS